MWIILAMQSDAWHMVLGVRIFSGFSCCLHVHLRLFQPISISKLLQHMFHEAESPSVGLCADGPEMPVRL